MLKLLPLYFDLSRYVILETLGGFTQRPYAILMNPSQFFYRDSDPYFPVFCYLSVQAFSLPSDFFYFCSLRDPHRKAQNMIEAKPALALPSHCCFYRDFGKAHLSLICVQETFYANHTTLASGRARLRNLFYPTKPVFHSIFSIV